MPYADPGSASGPTARDDDLDRCGAALGLQNGPQGCGGVVAGAGGVAACEDGGHCVGFRSDDGADAVDAAVEEVEPTGSHAPVDLVRRYAGAQQLGA